MYSVILKDEDNSEHCTFCNTMSEVKELIDNRLPNFDILSIQVCDNVILDYKDCLIKDSLEKGV